MKYHGYLIEKSGMNYRVREPDKSLMGEIAPTRKMAKKWIDADRAAKALRYQTMTCLAPAN